MPLALQWCTWKKKNNTPLIVSEVRRSDRLKHLAKGFKGKRCFDKNCLACAADALTINKKVFKCLYDKFGMAVDQSPVQNKSQVHKKQQKTSKKVNDDAKPKKDFKNSKKKWAYLGWKLCYFHFSSFCQQLAWSFAFLHIYVIQNPLRIISDLNIYGFIGYMDCMYSDCLVPLRLLLLSLWPESRIHCPQHHNIQSIWLNNLGKS